MPDAAPDFMLVLRAEGLGDRDRKAGAETQAQADHQEVHRAGSADRRQLFRTEIPANNRGIHKTVKLLEKHAEQHRQRKENNPLQGTVFCQVAGQIPGHTVKPLSTASRAVRKVISLLRQHSDKFTSKFKMLLGADNDYQGSKYDLMLICGAAATKSGASAKCYISECATKPDYKAHMITVRQDLYEDFKNLCRRSKTSDKMTIDCYDKNNTIVITRLRGDKYSDDALSSIILESDLIKNIVKEKAMGKDWNDDLKLLTKINSKISSLKINAYMSYDLFREKYDELSLQTNSPGHLTDVISIIKDRLTPLGGLDYSQESDKTQIKKSI